MAPKSIISTGSTRKNFDSSASFLSVSFSHPFSTPIRKERIRDTGEKFPYFSPSIYAIDPPNYEANTNQQRLVIAMVESKFTLNDLDCLPFGVALPLREALRSCRSSQKDHAKLFWPPEAYELIGREDLATKERAVASAVEKSSLSKNLPRSFTMLSSKQEVDDKNDTDGGTGYVVESSRLPPACGLEKTCACLKFVGFCEVILT